MLMNVFKILTFVMTMPPVLTLMGVTTAPATLAIKEMVSTAQVRMHIAISIICQEHTNPFGRY